MKCELVLLAAGQASRFGSDKRFVKLSNGLAMWRASLQIYLDAGMGGHLIVGENESVQFSNIPIGIELHECVDARKGLSHSLAYGLKQVKADFALLALADMPFLKTSTVLDLLKEVKQTSGVSAIAPSYKEQTGHPKLLSRDLFKDLCALQGDQGGFAVLKQLRGNQRLSIEVNDPGIHRDVDVPSDLELPTD
ncbi:MAG: NTP transferase domain-containing protein [Pseudomonadales bacterium]